MLQDQSPQQIKIDPIKFIEGTFKLRGKTIKLYDYQKKILEDPYPFVVINKSRQTGISTVIAMDALTNCMFKENFLHLVISRNEITTREIIGYCYDLLYSMPEPLVKFYVLKTESKTEFQFANGSRLICLANSSGAGRGFAANAVDLDEFAFVNEAEKDRDKQILSSVGPAISRGGKLRIISTPFGKQGEYWRIWSNPTNFSTHKINWKECPELVASGKDFLITSLPEPKEIYWAQEYENQFVESITGFIPVEWYDVAVNKSLRGFI